MSQLTRYKITEIFYSLQGEGFWTGTPAIFVRFSGCNLTCSWCDTNHEPREYLTQDELVQRLQTYSCQRVILTGGEPTLQVSEDLIDALHEHEFFVHVETNGINPPPSNVDWLTVSPKRYWQMKQGDELKVIYEGQDLEQYTASEFQHYFLQPLSMSNIPETIEKVKQCPNWRLSLQTHKLLDIA